MLEHRGRGPSSGRGGGSVSARRTGVVSWDATPGAPRPEREEQTVADAQDKADELKDQASEAAEQAEQKAKDVANASDGLSGNTGDGPGIDSSGPVADGFAGGNTPEVGS